MPAVVLSGIGTAVGTAIESVWGNPPLSAAGVPRQIGNTTNPHRFCVVQPTGGIPQKATINVPHNELDGTNMPVRSQIVEKVYQGDFSLLADSENLYNFMLALMGRDVQTILLPAVSNSGTPVIKHVMKIGARAPSLTVEEQFNDGSGRLATGCNVSRGEFTFGPEVTAKFTMQGRRSIPNDYLNATNVKTFYPFTATGSVIPAQMGGDGTLQLASTAVPTYVDVQQGNSGNGPFVWAGLRFGSVAAFSTAFLTIDGVAAPTAQPIKGSTMSIDRQLTYEMLAGSEYDVGSVCSHEVTLGGKLNFLYTDATLSAKHLAHSTFGLNFSFQGIQIGTSGINYSLEVYIPSFSLINAPIQLTDKELMITCDLDAILNRAIGSLAVITLVNTFDNTTLGGTVASNPSGLGGWLNA